MSDVPKDRWDINKWYDPDPEVHGKMYTRRGGFLGQLDQFDPHFFSISPREAMSMDPQQRLLLELAWEAFEDAGLGMPDLSGSNTGVFASLGPSHYVGGMRVGEPEKMDMYSGIGNSASVAMGRISFVFDLAGPNFPIETACSSSLVATHVACRSLRNRECDMALAGGVHIILAPEQTVYFCRMGVLSHQDRCSTFDASADGFVRSEGCGMVVLKRYSDAVADGDRIWGVIRGSAINHDGRGTGLLVPNPAAQEAVIREAIDNAGITPADLGYVEAHGTGTPIGDPAELVALGNVFRGCRNAEDPIVVGSVKTNVGHLELAAGVAGLIKTVLALDHREIPPHLHFVKPTPLVDWEQLPLHVPTKGLDWEPRNGRRLAGVSSYGFSGTNVHVILEEAPESPRPERPFQRPSHLCCLSARSEEALADWAARIGSRLDEDKSPGVEDVCHTINRGRSHFPCRVAYAVQSRDELRNGLTALASGDAEQVGGIAHTSGGELPAPVFLFTGQGAQYTDMGRVLYDTQPRFRATLDRCDTLLRDRLHTSLLHALYPSAEAESPLEQTAYTQPALFAVEYALADLWRSWGIKPAAVMGHSIGEITAACFAGVMSLEDGLTLVAARGRLMQALPSGGKMAVLMTDEDAVAAVLENAPGEGSIAAINGPDNTVVSGDAALVDHVVKALVSDGIRHQYLNVSHAFHSPHMDPMLDEFESLAAGITYGPPRIPVVSNVTGRLATNGEPTNAAYWRRHVRQPVRFMDGMRCLDDQGYRLFIEVGPKPILLGMGRKCINETGQHWLPSLRQRNADWRHLLESLRELYLLGFNVDWRGFDRGYPRTLVQLPHYPFERQRYWIDSGVHGTGGRRRGNQESLLGNRAPSPLGVAQFEGLLEFALLKDLPAYVVRGARALPLSNMIHMGFEGARKAFGDVPWTMDAFRLHAPVALSGGEARVLHTLFRSEDDGTIRFELFSHLASEGATADDWTLHADASLHMDVTPHPGIEEKAPSPADLSASDEYEPGDLAEYRNRTSLDDNALYGLDQLGQHKEMTLAHFSLPKPDAHEAGALPHAIEAALETLVLAAVHSGAAGPLVPVTVGTTRVHEYPGKSIWCRARLDKEQPPKDGGRRGSVFVTDEDDKALLELEGVTLAPPAWLDHAHLAAEVAHWCYDVTWKPTRPLAASEAHGPDSGYWIVYADESGCAESVAKAIGTSTAVVVRVGDAFQQESDTAYRVNPENSEDMRQLLAQIHEAHGPSCQGIVHAWSLGTSTGDPSAPGLVDASRRGCAGLLHLVQALTDGSLSGDVRLCVITRGARHVPALNGVGDTPHHAPPVAVAQSPAWGLCLSIAAEFPNLNPLCIDLDPAQAVDTDAAAAVAKEILTPPGEDLVAFRAGVRRVARLTRMHTHGSAPEARTGEPDTFAVREDATYLITGGFGGIGLIMARWLAERGARHLILTGRRGATEEAQPALAELARKGVNVHAGKGDVADRQALEQILADAAAAMPPLKGVLHAAGVLDEGLLAQRDWAQFLATLAPKVAGTWNLHELTQGHGLDFFVLFSSTSTLFRTPGLGPYAAANSFLDGMAHYRRALGLPATSVHWASWLEAGMAARRNETETKWGIGSLPPDGGVLALERALRSDWAEVGVVPVDWEAFAGEAPAMYQAPFLRDLLPEKALQAARRRKAKGPDPVLMELREATRERRIEILTTYIREKVAKVLGLDTIDDLDPDAPLAEMGLDSLMGFEIKSAIELAIGQAIPVSAMLENPTIANVVLYLVDQVMGRGESEAETEAVPEIDLAPELWLPFDTRYREPALRLFCFPYSGASAACYRPWVDAMPQRVELQALQYPGRRNRIGESALTTMDSLVDALESVLLPYLEGPYAFFGHSMGAMVAFSLCQRLQRDERPLPEHLYLSGCMAPQNRHLERCVADLSDDELMEELRKLGQTPDRVLASPELMDLYLPLIRADFAVFESCHPDPKHPLACPITVYGGTADPRVKALALGDWHSSTTSGFNIELFDGDHFFIHDPLSAFVGSFAQRVDVLAKMVAQRA